MRDRDNVTSGSIISHQSRIPPSQRATLALVLFGGFAAGIGWIWGVWRLWRDPTWSTLQKTLATLVFPGGLVPAFMLSGSTSGTSTCTTGLIGPHHVGAVIAHCSSTGVLNVDVARLLLAALVILPIAVVFSLYRSVNRTMNTLPES